MLFFHHLSHLLFKGCWIWGRWVGGGWRGRGGARLPDVIGAAGRFAVAGFPGALGGGPGPVGEQLVPQVAGETSGAVWWRGRERKPEEPSVCRGAEGSLCRVRLEWDTGRQRDTPPSTECGDGSRAQRDSRVACAQQGRVVSSKTHAEGNEPCKPESVSENTRGEPVPSGGAGSAYLKPSALGMKRLGLGGSLWQRGTLTGRGLFLGAGRGRKKKKKKKRSKHLPATAGRLSIQTRRGVGGL